MSFLKMTKPQTIVLYDDPTSDNLVLGEIRNYLIEKFKNINVMINSDFFSEYLKVDEIPKIAQRLANLKIRDLFQTNNDFEPLLGEITFEKKLLSEPNKSAVGVLYDGFKLQALFRELIPPDELTGEIIHIIFTNRIFATFDEADRRYHARVIICGYPSIISTSGIVEAPAKPKEFYRLKQNCINTGQSELAIDELKKQFQDRFIDYNDARLTEVMKGYVSQALFYTLTGEPFCKDAGCRLFNAHWQEELIHAQFSDPEFCEKHQNLLDQFR